MPDFLSTEVKEQVRQATDIVDLVGSYLPLSRQGQAYKALCPWHDDTRPSLQVNPDRQSFKCFVCNIGGDVFSFVMKMEGVEFPDALRLLAERAGIALPRRGRGGGPAPDKQLWYRTLAWAEDQFHRYLLEAGEAAAAREYLADRGISDESVRRFRLGFSPPGEWDWLLARGQPTEFSAAHLERVGLVIPRSEGRGHYDRFRGRLLFSIRDARGRTIAFGGRVLPHPEGTRARENDPKYINSPETPLFSKSGELYGLDLARDAIAREKTAIVVEGYTDCIMAHQQGLQNVVAVLGTALTEKHVPLLRRYAESVILVLDGDEAGRKRANEVLEIFVAHQFDLRILTLPQDADPCDFIAQHGSAAFRQLLGGAVDAIEHRIRTATEGMVATRETHRANEAIEQILATLAKAPRAHSATQGAHALRQQQILARLAREFHVPEEHLRTRLAELRKRRPRRRADSAGTAAPTPPPMPPKVPAWERELLELLLIAPESIGPLSAEIFPGDLEHPLARDVYQDCLDLDAAGRPIDLEALLARCDDLDGKSLLVQLDEEARAKRQSDLDQRTRDLVQAVRDRRSKEELARQLASFKDGTLPKEQEVEALSHFLQMRSRQAGSAPTEG